MIQQFSTSILTPGPDESAFPSDLLSKKTLATSDRTIGTKDSLKHLVPQNITVLLFLLTLIFISERRVNRLLGMNSSVV